MELERIAECINTLGDFCGRRDAESVDELPHVDVAVLFGGSIIAGGDIFAQMIEKNIADKYVIVGGAGHTTESLRQRVHEEYPDIETAGLSEAEVFNRYLKKNYGVEADYLETKSTNCGNNITYLLDLLRDKGISYDSVLLCQDATMQLRMCAGFEKYSDAKVVSFAAYHAKVVTVPAGKEAAAGGTAEAAADGTAKAAADGSAGLAFDEDIHGMWDMERYVNLLMGEIPRLSDNETGYGPKGSNFIAHVDMPADVIEAFNVLKDEYGAAVRVANPEFASK